MLKLEFQLLLQAYFPSNYIHSAWLFWYYDRINKKEDTFFHIKILGY